MKQHALALTTYILTMLLGIAGAVGYYADERAVLATERATKAEASARSALNKQYDYQESERDRTEAIEGAAQVELWKASQALEACKKGRT